MLICHETKTCRTDAGDVTDVQERSGYYELLVVDACGSLGEKDKKGECAIAEPLCVLAVAIVSHWPMSAAFKCRGDPEGWGPVSRLRPFDLTSCFEEGAILSPLLTVLLISALVACYLHRRHDVQPRCRKSVWTLRTKLVRLLCCMHPPAITNLIHLTY